MICYQQLTDKTGLILLIEEKKPEAMGLFPIFFLGNKHIPEKKR